MLPSYTLRRRTRPVFCGHQPYTLRNIKTVGQVKRSLKEWFLLSETYRISTRRSNCVQCSDCGKWFHQECKNLPANVFAALGKIKGLFWKCDTSVDNVVTAADQLQQLIQETKTSVSSFDVMKNELLNEIKAIKQSMTTFEEKMNLRLESVHVQNTKIAQKGQQQPQRNPRTTTNTILN